MQILKTRWPRRMKRTCSDSPICTSPTKGRIIGLVPLTRPSSRNSSKHLHRKKLTRIGIDPASIDQIFVSERDGKPFTIRYSVVGNMMGSREPVVFEAEGVDGQRMVGFLDMTVREVGSEEYDLLLAGKGPIEKAPARQ